VKLRRRWKVFWNLAVIFTIIVVVRRWDPPFDDSDLAVNAPQIAPEDNAFSLYLAIAHDLAGNLPRGTDLNHRYILKQPDLGWTHIAGLVQSNHMLLARMAEVGRLPAFQWPTEYPAGKSEIKLPVTEFLSLIRLQRLAGCLSVHEGNISNAVEHSVTSLQFAHHLEMDPASLIAWLTAMAVESIALAQTRETAAQDECSIEQARRLLLCLENNDNAKIGLGKLNAWFYQSDKSSLARMECAGLIAKNALDFIPSPSWLDGTSPATNWLMCKLGYLPNRTRRIMHESANISAGVEALPPMTNITWGAFYSHCEEWDSQFKNDSNKRFFRPNFLGETIATLINPDVHLDDYIKHRQAIDLTRVFMSLHLYKKEYGAFPRSLSDLVPAYMKVLPKDLYDGADVRYDRERGVVFSYWPVNAQRGDRPIQHKDALTSPPNHFPQRDNGATVLFLMPPTDP
jgi:hypothetical protein